MPDFSRRDKSSCFPMWPIPSIPTQRSPSSPGESLFAVWLLMLHLNINVHKSEWLKSGTMIYAKSCFSLFSCVPQALEVDLQANYLNDLASLHRKTACAQPQNVSPAVRARRWSDSFSSSVSPASKEKLLKSATTSPITYNTWVKCAKTYDSSKRSIRYRQVLQHRTNLHCPVSMAKGKLPI